MQDLADPHLRRVLLPIAKAGVILQEIRTRIFPPPICFSPDYEQKTKLDANR